jgi:hypothetical protein
LLKRLSFLHRMVLASLSGGCSCMNSYLGVYSVPLVFTSVFVPVS